MPTLSLPARRLKTADETWAARLLAEAYAHRARRTGRAAETEHGRVQLLARYALHAGSVYAGPHDQSVAAWLPAEATALSWGGLLRAGQLTLPLRLGWGTLRQLMQRQQQHDDLRHRALLVPHHQLLALGVQPGAQGQGAGRALLRASLAAVGARYLPCYTEVHSLAALYFAQQLGFEVAVFAELPLGPARLPCWGLVRAAGAV